MFRFFFLIPTTPLYAIAVVGAAKAVVSIVVLRKLSSIDKNLNDINSKMGVAVVKEVNDPEVVAVA